MTRSKARSAARGITLVELLVVFGIIGVLAGLLVPAVVAAKEAANRIRCVGNLRQLGVAAHSYEGVWLAFPPAATVTTVPGGGSNISPQCLLLPYLEQASLFDAVNFQVKGLALEAIDPANATVVATQVNLFLCPSDSQGWGAGSGATNYRANSGPCAFCDESYLGAFAGGRAVELAGFRDGLSQTLAFSEKLVGAGGSAPHRPARDWLHRTGIAAPRTGDEWLETCRSSSRNLVVRRDAGRTWLLSGGAHTLFYVSAPPNTEVPDCGILPVGGTGIFAARSLHPGGVNAAMADGSARWFTSRVSPATWRGLGTRDGTEMVP